LDEVEKALEAAMQVPIAVGGTDDRIVVWLESREAKLLDQVREIIRQRYGVHPSMSGLQLVEQLPYLSSGKKDYGALLRPS
jgi:hypothetical protein